MKNLLLSVSAVIFFLSTSPVVAQQLFIRTDGIVGGSTNPDYSGWSDATGVTSNVKGDRCGPIIVEKRLDKASLNYMFSASVGRTHAKTEIVNLATLGNGDQEEDARLTIYDAQILEIKTSGEEGSPIVETLSIIGTRVELFYTEYDDQGQVTGRFDVVVECNLKGNFQ